MDRDALSSALAAVLWVGVPWVATGGFHPAAAEDTYAACMDRVRLDPEEAFARAWSLGGRPERAHAVLTAAVKLQPEDPERLVDRAAVLAERGLYGGAVDDLDRAIALDPGRADSYAFRASAHRFLDDLGRAEADAEGALALDGNHPEALLERGIIRRLGGDDEGARSDWIRLLARAPGPPAAASARANPQRMDVKAR